ncbi:MAG: hypothetical protein ACW99U_21490 [Candidatus Thorarchaeota archaeon]|jgi:hypothetical protein
MSDKVELTLLNKVESPEYGEEFEDSSIDFELDIATFHAKFDVHGEEAWRNLPRRTAKVMFNTGRFNRLYVEDFAVIDLGPCFAVTQDELLDHC